MANEDLVQGAIDIGNGYVLLCARDQYRYTLVGVLKATIQTATGATTIKQWARLQLPNGQIAHSAWKEKQKAPGKVRISRMVQYEYGEVQYFFQHNARTFALLSIFSPPDDYIWRESFSTLWVCSYMGDSNLRVIDVGIITAVVSMQPFPVCVGEVDWGRWFVVEKAGLDDALGNQTYSELHTRWIKAMSELDAEKRVNSVLQASSTTYQAALSNRMFNSASEVNMPPTASSRGLLKVKSPLSPVRHEECSEVRFYSLGDWEQYKKERLEAGEVYSKLAFLEDIHSHPVSKSHRREMTCVLHECFNELHAAKADPPTWGKKRESTGEYTCQQLLKKCEEFRYCQDSRYKANLFASIKYPDWSRDSQGTGWLKRYLSHDLDEGNQSGAAWVAPNIYYDEPSAKASTLPTLYATGLDLPQQDLGNSILATNNVDIVVAEQPCDPAPTANTSDTSDTPDACSEKPAQLDQQLKPQQLIKRVPAGAAATTVPSPTISIRTSPAKLIWWCWFTWIATTKKRTPVKPNSSSTLRNLYLIDYIKYYPDTTAAEYKVVWDSLVSAEVKQEYTQQRKPDVV
ncbi:hypothetical protein BDN71DRAFT_1431254 [Pleurotus eryngii]|uniref:Uncharacterized protein n=1 Tax=Pleurotus eryngii TaxID=5323 RepID=A0A9P5ZVP3_PLEER|nr:hypothetical protein BDN71DRAFT_1431254 [Pleurotus eryngii]